MAIAIFISGTDTGVGKTQVAGLLCRALGADVAYYKPVQTGVSDLSEADVTAVQQLAPQTRCYSSYSLPLPAAPQLAATVAGVTISLDTLDQDLAAIRTQHRYVVVEGAGGLAVPVTSSGGRSETIATLIQRWQLPLVLVSRPHLGTINHTCLSLAYAQQLGLRLLGLVMNYHEPLKPSLIHTTAPDLIRGLSGSLPCHTLSWHSDATPLQPLVAAIQAL